MKLEQIFLFFFFFSRVRNGDDAGIQRRGGSREIVMGVDEMTRDLEGLLDGLSSVVDGMGRVVSDGNRHIVQRHVEIAQDYRGEFRKTRVGIAGSRKHGELMGGATTGSAGGIGTGVSNVGSVFMERASITAANNGADVAIATGVSLKEDLDRQRALFASMVERMESMSEGLPGVNRLIGQIRRKKRRDGVIFATVIATLLLITFCWRVAP